MKNLIKMSGYVGHQRLKGINDNVRRFWACEKYAKFITQPLELGMFVACDEDGNVLEEPQEKYDFDTTDFDFLCEKYKQAKAKVLFEGNFSVIDRKTYKIVKLDNKTIWVSWNKSKTIEDLIPYNLELTDNNF